MEGDFRAIERHLESIANELRLIREALEAQSEYDEREDEDEDDDYGDEENGGEE